MSTGFFGIFLVDNEPEWSYYNSISRSKHRARGSRHFDTQRVGRTLTEASPPHLHDFYYYMIAPICQMSTGFFGISRKRTNEHENTPMPSHPTLESFYNLLIINTFLGPENKTCPNPPSYWESLPRNPIQPEDPMAVDLVLDSSHWKSDLEGRLDCVLTLMNSLEVLIMTVMILLI